MSLARALSYAACISGLSTDSTGMPLAPVITAYQESLTLLEPGMTEYWLLRRSLSSVSRNVFR